MVVRARVTLGLISILFISAGLLAWKYFEPVVALDEGIALVYPELILKGLIPNLDFASLYTPGNFWLIAIFYKLFGVSIIVERIIGFLYIVAIAYAIFLLCLDSGIFLAIVLGVSVSVILEIFPTALAAYSWFGAAAAALWSLALLDRSLKTTERTGASLFFAGVLGGVTILFRQDLAPAIGMAGLIACGARVRPIRTYLLGFLIGVSPLLVQAIIATPSAVLENWVWDVLRAGPTRRLPINPRSILLWIVGLSCVGPLLLAALQIRRVWARPNRIILSIAVFSLAVLPQALSRADRWHLAYVGCLTIPLAAIVLLKTATVMWGHAPGLWWSRLRYQWQAAALCCTAAVIGLFLVQWTIKPLYWELLKLGLGQQPCVGCVTNEGRSLWVASAPLELQTITDELEKRSKPGDLLFVGPFDLSRTNYNDSYLYYLFPKLKPGSYYIEMASQVANRPGTRLSANLSNSDFALLDTAYDDWHEDNTSVIAGSVEPLAVLKAEFCLAMERKPYLLYVRCTPRPAKNPSS